MYESLNTLIFQRMRIVLKQACLRRLGLELGIALCGISILAGCVAPPRPIVIVVPDSHAESLEERGGNILGDNMFIYTRQQIEEIASDRPRSYGRSLPTAEVLAYEALLEMSQQEVPLGEAVTRPKLSETEVKQEADELDEEVLPDEVVEFDTEDLEIAEVEAEIDAPETEGGWLRRFFGRDRRSRDDPVEAAAMVAPETTRGRVQPGDEISVEVFREPDFSGTFRVNQDGLIRHPLMGSLQLEGLTAKEVEDKITADLAARFLVDPRVVVTLAHEQQSRIVLLGEVKRPGVYDYPVGESLTLLEAIAKAGGFTDLASVDRVRLVRSSNGDSESIRIRISRVLSGREQDVELQPNDVITVPEVRF